MGSKTSAQNQLCKRLSAIGIRQEYVYSIISDFQKWTSESGAEWTISRLKSLKVAYFNALADKPQWPEWVAMASDGFPKGTIGRLMKQSFECSDSAKPKMIQRTISTLMVYSDLMSNHITEKQWKKFQTSVEKPRSEKHMNLVHEYSTLGTPSQDIPKGYSLFDWKVNSSTREPLMDSLLQGKASTKPENGLELVNGFKHPLAQQYIYDGYHSFSPFGEVNNDIIHLDMMTMAALIDKKIIPTKEMAEPYPPVGKIGFIQEPGYKLRAVANPHRIFQFLLNPLKESLLNKLKQLESDCTHDQEKGVTWAHNMIQENLSLSSVDLSDATNNFPLRVQMYMLRSTYKNTEILDLFEMVSKSPWLVHDPLTGKVREISWTVGQPLGLGPSFPAFAAAHHMIMWETIALVENGNPNLGREHFLQFLNGNKSNMALYCNKYRILGDDIVMLTKYENAYINKLSSMDMPVSKDKTITSPKIAEFASRVITRDSIFVQNKWKIPSDRNFLALAKNLGPTSIGLFRNKQQSIVKALAKLPEWEGGLGWNPKGLSAQARIAAYKPYLDNKNKEEADLYARRETLALEKAKTFLGDDLAYNVVKPIESSISNHKREIAAERPAQTKSRIDYVMNIQTEKAFSPLDVDSDKVPFDLSRPNGDPRGASVLSQFSNPKMRDMLKASNENLKYLESLIGTNHESKIDDFIKDCDNAVLNSCFNAAFVNTGIKRIQDSIAMGQNQILFDIADSYREDDLSSADNDNVDNDLHRH